MATIPAYGMLNDLTTRARSENPFYIAMIYQPSSGLGFRGWVPQEFNVRIHNNWEPVFGHFNEQSSVGTRIAQAMGVPVNVKALTQQIWTGTDPLEFQFFAGCLQGCRARRSHAD
jgi:hypothetical protein